MKELKLIFFVLITGLLFSGCESGNIFSWTHSKGSDKSSAALLADAEKALDDENYEVAIDYYDEILKKDPDNSEALYGIASAELKNAGLDIAKLLPNIISQDTTGAEDLISQLNFTDLEAGTAAAIEALERIASGKADGTIPADNVDVNLNLAIAKTVHAVASLINDYSIDVKNDFTISDTSGITQADKDSTIAEIESAITYLEVAAASADVDIADIKAGFNNFKAQLQ